MRRFLAALLLILLWAGSAYADEPRPPQAWERIVGPYRFVMLTPPGWTPQGSEESFYPATGLYRADGPPEPLWVVDWYAFEEEVFLSPEGEYLARMGPWPGSERYDDLAVAFYRNGSLTKAYLVKDLVAKPENLPHSVSHYQWRQQVSFDPDQLRLTVVTIPGITYRFDVKTGAVLGPSIGQADPGSKGQRADWAPIISWTIGGLVVVGSMWILTKDRLR